jgi:hypothetical protein
MRRVQRNMTVIIRRKVARSQVKFADIADIAGDARERRLPDPQSQVLRRQR